MIYTVTFNPALDYVLHIDHFTPGCVNRTVFEKIYFGGKGINVSVVLKTLGAESTALGFIAGFTGAALENDLRRRGIASQLIPLPEGLSRINIKLKGQSETEINANGPDIPPSALNQLFRQLDSLCAGDILVLAGSVPACLPRDIYGQILSRLQNRSIQTVVDASGCLLTSVLCYHPFLIKPNQHELEEIFGQALHNEKEMICCARQLKKMGARNICISMAASGAILLTQDDELYRIHAPQGTVKNSVGAGDSLVAGFLAGYLETEDFSYALQLGTAAGSATAFSDGLASKEAIDHLMKQLEVPQKATSRLDDSFN